MYFLTTWMHAVHVDDAHVKILMRISHTPGAKKTIIPHLIPPSIYVVMHVLDLDLLKLRFPAWLNDFLHSVHSPLWVRMCQILSSVCFGLLV